MGQAIARLKVFGTLLRATAKKGFYREDKLAKQECYLTVSSLSGCFTWEILVGCLNWWFLCFLFLDSRALTLTSVLIAIKAPPILMVPSVNYFKSQV